MMWEVSNGHIGKFAHTMKGIEMKKIIALIIIVVFSTCSAQAAEQENAMSAVQGPVQQGIDLLRNMQYKDASQRELQRVKIWEIIRQAFDFNEVAMRALAQDWKNFNS